VVARRLAKAAAVLVRQRRRHVRVRVHCCSFRLYLQRNIGTETSEQQPDPV
jgi:hypothetical protein